METKVDFKKIKEQLPYGSQTIIAKRANVSVSAVNNALKGNCENVNLLNTIADYLTEIKAKKTAALNRISSLID
jgi:hypothetical protein